MGEQFHDAMPASGCVVRVIGSDHADVAPGGVKQLVDAAIPTGSLKAYHR